MKPEYEIFLSGFISINHLINTLNPVHRIIKFNLK